MAESIINPNDKFQDIQPVFHKLACGHTHSIAIVEKEKKQTEIYVWGSNKEGQLALASKKGEAVNFDKPFLGQINFHNTNYLAKEVSAGKNFTAILGTLECEEVNKKETHLVERFLKMLQSNIHEDLYTAFGGRSVTLEDFKEKLNKHRIEINKAEEDYILKFYKDANSSDLTNQKIDIRKIKNQLLGYAEDKGILFLYGKLGTKQYKGNQQMPIKDAVYKVSCGDSHIMVITYGNELFAWGSNSSGQLGTGDFQDRDNPEKIYLPSFDEKPIDVACGSLHTLMLSDTLDV